VAIRQSKMLREHIAHCLDDAGELRVCAFGGGPGTELLALAKHIIKSGRTGPPATIDFTLIERVTEWCESWTALEGEIKKHLRSKHKHANQWPFVISKTFLNFDMLNISHYANVSQVLKHDLYIMNYVVSEVIATKSAFQNVVDRMARSPSPTPTSSTPSPKAAWTTSNPSPPKSAPAPRHSLCAAQDSR